MLEIAFDPRNRNAIEQEAAEIAEIQWLGQISGKFESHFQGK